MKQLKLYLKENKLVILYLIFVSFLNFQYVYFVVSKSQYALKHLLEGTIETQHFEYLSSISKLTNFLETLIILILLIYLLIVFIRKDKVDIKNFLVVNFSFFVGFALISSLISFIFSAPIGNLTQQLFTPFAIMFMVFIYYIFKGFRDSKTVK